MKQPLDTELLAVFAAPRSTVKLAGGPRALHELFASRMGGFCRGERVSASVRFDAVAAVVETASDFLRLSLSPTQGGDEALYVVAVTPGAPEAFRALAALIGEWPELRAPEQPSAGLLARAIEIARIHQKASISFLQRKLQIGYNLSAHLVETLERIGVVSPPDHTGKRVVLVR